MAGERPVRARLASEPAPDGVAHAFPGARRPDRQRWVRSHGLELSVWEWGDLDAPPVLFAHGGFDFAGTFDGLAPLVADAGWRVVSWDQRGHGDSAHPTLYSWEADVRDAAAVMATLGDGPMPVLGHSKGGALILQLAEACPHLISRLINLDGVPSARSWPDVPEHLRTRLRQQETESWLAHRKAAGTKTRRPGTISELAERRGRMNPRLSQEWLEYLVPIGARPVDGGWRWKIDPTLRPGGFGPWRPEWSTWRLPSLGVPTLCVLGLEVEPMAWGTLPEDVVPYLPAGGRFVGLEGVGHFVHVEQPRVVADLVVEHLS